MGGGRRKVTEGDGEEGRKESRVNNLRTDVLQTHNVERMILMKGKGRISVAFVEAVGEVTGGRRKLCVLVCVCLERVNLWLLVQLGIRERQKRKEF